MCTSVYTTDFAATDLASSFSFSYDVVFAARVTFRLAWKVHFRVLHLSSPAGWLWLGWLCVCASLPFHEDARLEQGIGCLAFAKRDGPP